MAKYTKRTGTPGHYKYEYADQGGGNGGKQAAAPAPTKKIGFEEAETLITLAHMNSQDTAKPYTWKGIHDDNAAQKNAAVLDKLPNGTVITFFDESGYGDQSAVKYQDRWVTQGEKTTTSMFDEDDDAEYGHDFSSKDMGFIISEDWTDSHISLPKNRKVPSTPEEMAELQKDIAHAEDQIKSNTENIATMTKLAEKAKGTMQEAQWRNNAAHSAKTVARYQQHLAMLSKFLPKSPPQASTAPSFNDSVTEALKSIPKDNKAAAVLRAGDPKKAAYELEKLSMGPFADDAMKILDVANKVFAASKKVEKSMSLTDWIQKSEAQPEAFEKGMHYVDDWAMQFAGTDMHVESLQCLKDMMGLRKERDKFNAAGKSWREEEDMSGTARKAYRDKRMKEREKFNQREDAIRARMSGLEEKLLDERIKDAKMRKSDDGGTDMEKALPGKMKTSEGANRTPPKEYRQGGATGKKDYADPANFKYPIDTEEHVRAAISYFSKPKNAGAYSTAEQKSIWGRIKSAAKKFGITLSDKSGPASVEKSMVADDGKPGKSLKETSDEELKATLAKLKPTDPGAKARMAAISAELKSRKKTMAKSHGNSPSMVPDKSGPMVGKAMPSASADISPEKARKILHDGTVHGKPITEQQRKFFGAIGGHLPAPKGKVKKSMSYTSLDDFLEKAEAPDFKKWMIDIFNKKNGGTTEKSMASDLDDWLEKAEGGPFVGPRGGKWADAQHTIPWSEKRAQAGKKQEQPKGTADQPFAEELKLTIENEGQLYNQIQSIQKNLINKMAAGNYDHAQAAKLWNYAVENGAKLYNKQFGVQADKATRMATARAMSDQFFEEATSGEYNHMLNKKNAAAMEGVSPEEFKNLASGKAKAEDVHAVKVSAKEKSTLQAAQKFSGVAMGGSFGSATHISKMVDKGLMERSKTNSMLYVPTEKGKRALKKSMEGVMSLEEYLEKSGGLPTGEPSLESNPANGGAVAGVGMTSGSSDSASGPGQNAQGQLSGVPTGGKEKLSEDDADVEGQMTTHKKPIETIKKSAFPADQRDSVAHEQAALVSRLHKSDDVYVGPNAHPFSSHATHASGDTDASELVKSEGFYHGQSPQVAPNRPIIEQGVLCKSINAGGCDSVYSAALTSCPDCGAGTVGHRHLPGGEVVGAQTTILEKSMGPGSLLRRPPQEPDIKIG